MKIELSNDPTSEGSIRVFPLRIHKNAELLYEGLEDRIEIKLINKETGIKSEKTYFKLKDEVFSVIEAAKIDTILYHMHNEIGLNLWDLK